MINDENRQAGEAFAGAFQGALVAALREHQNLRLYEVHILNPNTVFMLANGEREMVIDTKLRRSCGRNDWFGINAHEWFAWHRPDLDHLWAVQIVLDAEGQAVELGREMRPIRPVAILGYACYRPVDERLIAQWIDFIQVAGVNGRFVDTRLGSYTTLSAVLQQRIGMDAELAEWIQQRTLANALERPILEPDAP